jgi:hypothetical protein
VDHRNQTLQLNFQTPDNSKNLIHFIVLFSDSLFKCHCLLHNPNSAFYQIFHFTKFFVLFTHLFYNAFQNCFYRLIYSEIDMDYENF